MTLKALTVIVLRLFAIQFLLQSILDVVFYLPSLFETGGYGMFIYAVFYPTALLVVAGAIWVLAGWFAGLATRGVDGPLSLGALTKEDLYRFVFLFLGLYFALSAVGAVVTEWNQFIQLYAENAFPSANLTQFTKPLVSHTITLIAGLACIFGGKAWTRKMLRYEQKDEPA